MAVTRVTHTSKGFSAIDYVLSGKAHVQDKYVSGRVLDATGINCTVHGCRQQMNAVWKRYGINRPTRRHRRQVQRLIQSFDPEQLDYRKPADVSKANRLGQALAHRLYPHRQSIVVTQADNKHHVLHNHIITNMLDFRTGKSMNSRQTNFYNISHVSDDIIRSAGLDPEHHKLMKHTVYGREPAGTSHKTDAEYHIQKNNRYSWVNDLRSKVRKISDDSDDWHDFISKASQAGINVDPYRKRKGKPRLDAKGKPVFKAHVTYKFKDKNGKARTIRDRKLGHDYGKDYLAHTFSNNASIARSATSASISASASVSASASSAKASIASSATAWRSSVSAVQSANEASVSSESTSISKASKSIASASKTASVATSRTADLISEFQPIKNKSGRYYSHKNYERVARNGENVNFGKGYQYYSAKDLINRGLNNYQYKADEARQSYGYWHRMAVNIKSKVKSFFKKTKHKIFGFIYHRFDDVYNHKISRQHFRDEYYPLGTWKTYIKSSVHSRKYDDSTTTSVSSSKASGSAKAVGSSSSISSSSSSSSDSFTPRQLANRRRLWGITNDDDDLTP